MCKSRLPPAAWRSILDVRKFLFEQEPRSLHWEDNGRFAQEDNPDVEFDPEEDEEWEFERHPGVYNHSSKKKLMEHKGDPSALLVTNFVVALPNKSENPQIKQNTALRVQLARIVKIHPNRKTLYVRWWTSNAETLKRAKWRLYTSLHSTYVGATEISVDEVLVTFEAITSLGLIPERFRQAIAYKLQKKDEGLREWNRVVDQRALEADISMETDGSNIEEYSDYLSQSAGTQRLTLYPESKVTKSGSDDEDTDDEDTGDDNSAIGIGSDDE